MAMMRYWNGTEWIPFDTYGAMRLEGKKASDFAPASHVGSAGDAHGVAVPNGAAGFQSGADKAKLDGIQAGAQKNQDAFASIRVGEKNVAADSASDTLELVAGSNVVIDADEASDRITISATVDVADTTSPGGTEANKIAKTNTQGRVGDSERIGGKSLYELDLRFAAAANGGGGGSGSGEAIFGNEADAVRISAASATVKIPFFTFDPTKEVLLVFQNGLLIQHGKEYTVDAAKKEIKKISGTWNAQTLFDFITLKVTSSGDMLKIHQYESLVKATTENQQQIPINIPEYQAGLDGLSVYADGKRLSAKADYTLNTDGTQINLLRNLQKLGTEYQFVVMKKEKI